MATNKKSASKQTKSKKPTCKKLSGKAHETCAKSKPHEEHAKGKTEPKIVTVDRRTNRQDRRAETDRRQKSVPIAVERRACERRLKVNRRRQIDPTTCERDYTLEEIDFMNAIELYKRSSGRMFPTCSEILEVLKKMGYEKRDPQPESVQLPVAAPLTDSTVLSEITQPLTVI